MGGRKKATVQDQQSDARGSQPHPTDKNAEVYTGTFNQGGTDPNSELSPEPVMSLHKLRIRRFLDFLMMSLKSKPKELDSLKAKCSACCPSSGRSQGS